MRETLCMLIIALAVQGSLMIDLAYRGCYMDDGQQNLLNETTLGLTESVFPVQEIDEIAGFSCSAGDSVRTACRVHCLRTNKRYFSFRGVQSGTVVVTSRCYCGDTFPGTEADDVTDCSYGNCGDVRSGGGDDSTGYISVYKVFESTGCSSVAGIRSVYVDDFVTPIVSVPGRCRAYCLDQNMAFYGLLVSGGSARCYCLRDNDISRQDLTTSAKCTRTCTADRVPCGGDDDFGSIYTVCPLHYTLDSNGICSQSCNCSSGVCHPDGSCVTCPQGFKGELCQQDTDECQEASACEYGSCENTDGSYRCECDTGYQLTNQETSCDDIDECQENTNLCENGLCLNTPGSYRCVCDDGYQNRNLMNTSCVGDTNSASQQTMNSWLLKFSVIIGLVHKLMHWKQ